MQKGSHTLGPMERPRDELLRTRRHSFINQDTKLHAKLWNAIGAAVSNVVTVSLYTQAQWQEPPQGKK